MRELEKTIKINASQRSVWDVLADFGGVAKWAPGIRRSRLVGKQESGVGTRRSMRHFWGFRIDETATRWKEGVELTFELTQTPYPLRNVRESWFIKTLDSGTIVTTTVRYNLRLGVIGTWLDWSLVRFLIAREMWRGARGLKRYSERQSTPIASLGTPDTPQLESKSD